MKISGIDIKSYYLFSLISLALIVALGLLFIPLHLFLTAIILLSVLFLYTAFPKSTLLIFGIFMLFQDLIAFQLGATLLLATMVKRLEEVVILIAFLSLLPKKFLLKESWQKTNIDFPLLGLIAIAIIGSLKNHIVPPRIAALDLFLLLKGFLVFYIFYNLHFNIKDIRKTVNIFFSIALMVFILGIIDLIAPGFFRNLIHNKALIEYRFGMPSVKSIFVEPGVFGWFMAFFACFGFAFFIFLKKRIYLLYSILFSLGAVLSMRVKPIVGLLIAMPLAITFIPGVKKGRLIFVIVLLFLLFGCLFGSKINMLFEDQIYSYLHSPYINTQARNVLYSTSLRIARDYFPFGSGLGTFGGWISALYYSPLYAKYGIDSIYGLEKGGEFITDTFWPYLTAQFGIFGIICYVWIILLFFRDSIKALNENSDLLLKAFALGTSMILVEAIIETIASSVFLEPPKHFFIFASLGIACSLMRKKEFKKNENSSNQ